MIIAIIVIAVYVTGMIVYCRLNRDRVGEEGYEILSDGNAHPYTTDEETIAFESVFWPAQLIMFVILLPIMLLTKIMKL